MLGRLIEWSIDTRLVVLVAAVLLVFAGGYLAVTMPIDVLPDLTAPTVTVLTEAHGMATEEVERLITFPIETSVTGATGVRRVRSSSALGISVIWVEFDWGTDIYRARQIVNEKLQLAAANLPEQADVPVMGPITSIMGEIMLIGLRSDTLSLMELRTIADWTIRYRLMAVPGVAQVVPLGGEVRQYQVLVDPARLAAYGLSIDDVAEAAGEAHDAGTGSFINYRSRELPVRVLGQVYSLGALGRSVVQRRERGTILIDHLAETRLAGAPKLGAGAVNGSPAVVLSIQKQPGIDTLELTERIDDELDRITEGLPAGVTIEREIFRQATFISGAIANVAAALRDGAVLAVLVLVVFLLSWRTTLISALAIPLSLLATVCGLWALGITINTMTLGGMAIAIGALVDDAIIGVENMLKRLRQRIAGLTGDSGAEASESADAAAPATELNPADIRIAVLDAAREVVVPIVYATLVVIAVFLPLFFLSGVEGRLLQPLGLAYVLAILASLLVSLTVTPALCLMLLPAAARKSIDEPPVVRALQRLYRPTIRLVVRWPRVVVGIACIALVGAVSSFPFMGRTFLPEFNEGTLVINSVTLPGTSLADSDVLGTMIEQIALDEPEVVATSRRTGRAEMSEHAQGANESEIDVVYQLGERSRESFLESLRANLTLVPGTTITIGQPLGHRIDHMLSGTQAAIAIKVFGPDLGTLRGLARQIRDTVEGTAGLVDLQVEQQAHVPQLQISVDREALYRYGASAKEVLEQVETAVGGRIVGQIREGDRVFDLVVRFVDDARDEPDAVMRLPVHTQRGPIPVGQLASVREERGPNLVNRENGQRKIVVSANVAGRDVGSVVDELRQRIDDGTDLPADYFVQFGGQFESQQQAARTISLASLLAFALIGLLLHTAFRSWRASTVVMLSLPLSLIGGVATLFATGGVLSIAALVGLVTLFGIAARNGILLVARYRDLAAAGHDIEEVVREGSVDRLAPILMTALTTGLALIPLALGGGQPGNEIQTPLAQVVLGGLLTSTALSLVVLPAAYILLGEQRVERP
jgi:CzcA family heavy metal efflux pump